MRQVSLTDLGELVGKDGRTVKARLAEAGLEPIQRRGKAILYDSERALQAIYAPTRGGLEHLSPTDRLAHARWELAELDLATKRGELLDRAVVLATWGGMVASFRTRMLSIPSKVAPQVAIPGKVQMVEDTIAAAVHEALAEVSGDGLPSAR